MMKAEFQKTTIEFSFEIPATHPSLLGHFPGNPIVPGVVLLEQVSMQLTEHFPNYEIQAVSQSKFMQPVLPMQPVSGLLTVSFSADRAILKASFSLSLDSESESDSVCAKGQLVLSPKLLDSR